MSGLLLDSRVLLIQCPRCLEELLHFDLYILGLLFLLLTRLLALTLRRDRVDVGSEPGISGDGRRCLLLVSWHSFCRRQAVCGIGLCQLVLDWVGMRLRGDLHVLNDVTCARSRIELATLQIIIILLLTALHATVI